MAKINLFIVTKLSQHFRGPNGVDFQIVTNCERKTLRLFRRKSADKNEWDEIKSTYLEEHSKELFAQLELHMMSDMNDKLNDLMATIVMEKFT